MKEKKNAFVSEKQKLMWEAFEGKCGSEFAGNPLFMEVFMSCEKEKIRDDGREL